MASVSVFSFDILDLGSGLDCVTDTTYYAGFKVMCITPVVCVLMILGVYAVVRATHRASLKRRFGAGYRCIFDMPSRKRAIPIELRGMLHRFTLWRALDGLLDAIEWVVACRWWRRRQAAARVTPGSPADSAAATAAAAAESDPFATVNEEDLKLLEGAQAHGAGDQINRLRTLRVFWAQGSARARIWTGLKMLRDDHNMLGSQELCSCIPRNTMMDLPFGFMMCERGKAQSFLLSFRLRVRRRAGAGRGCVRMCFCVRQLLSIFGLAFCACFVFTGV